jgi:hypothetical protein
LLVRERRHSAPCVVSPELHAMGAAASVSTLSLIHEHTEKHKQTQKTNSILRSSLFVPALTDNPALAPFANVPCRCQRYFMASPLSTRESSAAAFSAFFSVLVLFLLPGLYQYSPACFYRSDRTVRSRQRLSLPVLIRASRAHPVHHAAAGSSPEFASAGLRAFPQPRARRSPVRPPCLSLWLLCIKCG